MQLASIHRTGPRFVGSTGHLRGELRTSAHEILPVEGSKIWPNGPKMPKFKSFKTIFCMN